MKTKFLFFIIVSFLFSPMFSQFNWEKMHSVYPSSVQNITINLSIANDQVIWGNYWNANGKVAFTKSTDSGNTWAAIPTVFQYNDYNFSVRDFAAVSENIAFLGTNYQPDIGRGRLYKTTDGGNSWNLIKQFTSGINYVHFWNANEGIVVCHPDMQSGGSQRIEVYKTNDGGTTWVSKGGNQFANSQTGQIPRFIRDNNGDSFWFGSSAGEIIRTNDKGETWTVKQTNYDSFAYEFANSIGDIAIIDHNSAFFVNFNTGKLYKTTDGFTTEQLISDPGFGKNTSLAKIPNTNILVASGAAAGSFYFTSVSGSKYSTDGGVTWTSISNIGRINVQSKGLNMTFAYGWDGAGGNDDYWRFVKLSGNLPPNPTTPTSPSTPNPPTTPIPPGSTETPQLPGSNEEVDFAIYPVPTENFLNFNTENLPVDYNIWDSAGRLITKGITMDKKVDVSYFQDGIYHIKVLYDGKTIIRKFIKK